MLKACLGDATRVGLLQANVHCELATQRLKGIEENIGPTLVTKFTKLARRAGTGAFLPSKSKIHCESVLLDAKQEKQLTTYLPLLPQILQERMC